MYVFLRCKQILICFVKTSYLTCAFAQYVKMGRSLLYVQYMEHSRQYPEQFDLHSCLQ